MRRPAPDANSLGPSACARRRRTKESGEGEIIGRLALLSDPPRARTAIKTARNAPGGHPLTALLPPQTVDRRYLSHRAGRCTPPSPLARPHPPLVVSGGCTRARRRLSAHRTTATTAPATVARRSASMPPSPSPHAPPLACGALRARLHVRARAARPPACQCAAHNAPACPHTIHHPPKQAGAALATSHPLRRRPSTRRAPARSSPSAHLPAALRSPPTPSVPPSRRPCSPSTNLAPNSSCMPMQPMPGTQRGRTRAQPSQRSHGSSVRALAAWATAGARSPLVAARHAARRRSCEKIET